MGIRDFYYIAKWFFIRDWKYYHHGHHWGSKMKPGEIEGMLYFIYILRTKKCYFLSDYLRNKLVNSGIYYAPVAKAPLIKGEDGILRPLRDKNGRLVGAGHGFGQYHRRFDFRVNKDFISIQGENFVEGRESYKFYYRFPTK